MTPTFNPIRRHRERCRHTRAFMSDYLDGELDARTAAQVERHVRWCPNCRRMLANLTHMVRALGDLAERAAPGEVV